MKKLHPREFLSTFLQGSSAVTGHDAKWEKRCVIAVKCYLVLTLFNILQKCS